MKLNELLKCPERHGLNPECQIARHPEYPRYWITDAGQVLTVSKTWDGTDVVRQIASCVTRTGYIDYVLTDRHGARRHKYAHKLVVELYLLNPENKPEINHLDHDKSNNQISNLQWVTHAENQTYSRRLNRWKRKISAEQENTIIEQSKTMSQRELSAMYGVSYATINQIVRLRGGVIARRNLSIDTRLKIIARVIAGEKPADLASEYGVTVAAICHIVRRGTPKRK